MDLEDVPHPSIADLLAAQEAPGREIVYLDPDCTEFSTEHHTYRATESLSPLRYKAFQKLQIEFGTDGSFNSLVEQAKALRDALKAKDDYTAAVINNEFLKGIANAGEQRNSGMEICALFFCLPGENQRTYNHALQMAKLRDWEEAGISQLFFFRVAARLVPHFSGIFNELSEIFLTNPLP